MNQPAIIWRCIIILLIFSVKRCPLAPAGSQKFIGHGHLTVEPAPPFLMGSNLTAYCRITECVSNPKISLHLNDVMVTSRTKINCTTVKFDLVGVQKPLSTLICTMRRDQETLIVNGMDLHGGLPPSKPYSVACETTRGSDVIACSWKRGQQTYCSSTYNVSVSSIRENGSQQVLFSQVRDTENVTVPRGILDENTNYHLVIAVYNRFGESRCEPLTFRVKDTVVPDIPQIMQVEFGNSSTAAVLQWNTSDSSEHLRPYVRLRTHGRPWKVREGLELNKDLIKVDDLRPLTEYEFEMRTCKLTPEVLRTSSTSSFPSWSTPTRGSLCSHWSRPVSGRSPGKGPSQQLRVWRTFSNPDANRPWKLTVLWKPPPADDFSGEVQRYVIYLDNEEVPCGAALTQSTVEVRGEEPALTISAVTSYGTSPPAALPLRRSGGFVPALKEVTPASSGSAVLVSWSWPEAEQWSTSGEEVLHYVVEWTSVPAAQLQWQMLDKSQNRTSITGLTPGVRYNISLYAVSSGGVSAPSSQLVYSKELKPAAGPRLRVAVHNTRRLLVQWDELPVSQQNGFITNYTIYIQPLDNSPGLNATVPGSGPRQLWSDCPEGTLAVQLSASTSAGEGPMSRVVSQPEAPAVGLVIVVIFIIVLFLAVVANLMCWSCVRKRIKQKCVTWGPAWLVENLPKPGNSNAIRLLELGGSEPSLMCTHSDPPLSPITLVSWEERDDVYPSIHVETFDSGQPAVASGCTTAPGGAQLQHVCYKPQVAMSALQQEEVKEAEEEQGDVDDRCSGVFEGFLGDLLSSVEVDFSNSALGLTLSSVGGLSWLKTSPVLNRGFLPVQRASEEDAEAESSSPRLQQGRVTSADVSLAHYSAGTTLPCSYFPQVAAVGSSQV